MVVAEMYVIVGYGGLIHKTGLNMSTAPLLGLLITLMMVSLLANTALSVAGRRLAHGTRSGGPRRSGPLKSAHLRR